MARQDAPNPKPDAEFDRRVMAAALRIGRREMGQVNPNPAVGCIIVAGRVVVGRGWTAAGGRPHAEQVALAEAGERARGATAYVTLEPCAHDSKDGPCAGLLAAAGIARAVIAMRDPDPRTNGRGIAMLKEAGVAVTEGVLAAEAAQAHSGHIRRVTLGRPHVTLKLAISADGMIGRREGERMMITGKQTFDAVQVMRTEYDALMVGIGTVLVDDPRLTVRLPGLLDRAPARVILDATARLPVESRLLQNLEAEPPLIIFVSPEAPADRVSAIRQSGAKVITVPASGKGLDMPAVLSALAEEGHARVFAEGGARVAASLVSGDLLDEIVIYRAPVVVGADGVRALEGMALSAIERTPRYVTVETVDVGEDVMRRYVRAA